MTSSTLRPALATGLIAGILTLILVEPALAQAANIEGADAFDEGVARRQVRGPHDVEMVPGERTDATDDDATLDSGLHHPLPQTEEKVFARTEPDLNDPRHR